MFVAPKSPFPTCQVSVMQGCQEHSLRNTRSLVSREQCLSGLAASREQADQPLPVCFPLSMSLEGLCFQMESVSFSCCQAFPQGLQLYKSLTLLSRGLPSLCVKGCATLLSWMWDPSAGGALQAEVSLGDLTLWFLTVKGHDALRGTTSISPSRAARSQGQSCATREGLQAL